MKIKRVSKNIDYYLGYESLCYSRLPSKKVTFYVVLLWVIKIPIRSYYSIATYPIVPGIDCYRFGIKAECITTLGYTRYEKPCYTIVESLPVNAIHYNNSPCYRGFWV